MDVEVSAEAKDKRLNRMVAVTVVVLSVFTGVCNIKDGNLVQAMQQAKADSVDYWGEYQATRTKAHIAETSRTEIAILAGARPSPQAQAALAAIDADIAKYKKETPQLAAKAQGQADLYDALNVHDDQFDASEALIATAISMAAVSALVESFWVLAISWVFGGFGMFMGICGFARLKAGAVPDLGLAQEAAKRAAVDLQRVRAGLRHLRIDGLADVRDEGLALPQASPRRPEIVEQFGADQMRGPTRFRRLHCRRRRPHNPRADRRPAMLGAHRDIALGVHPGSDHRIGGGMGRCGERGEQEGDHEGSFEAGRARLASPA
jgi:hypothetical protein